MFDLSPVLSWCWIPVSGSWRRTRRMRAATLSAERGLVGLNLFEAFPENPDHKNDAEGLSVLRASLLRVLKTKAPDTIPDMRP